MCRNKRWISLLLGTVLVLTLPACSASKKLVTDTGSSGAKEIAKEEYLDLEALKNPTRQTETGNYKVHTLARGVFEEEALKQSLERVFLNVPEIKLELASGTVQMGEYKAGYFEYVKPGDVIATVYSEMDELAIEEARLKLTRLQERYKRAQEKQEETLEDLKVSRTMIYNDYEREVMDVQYRQQELDWEMTKKSYERQIADAEEQLNNLQESSTMTEIKTEQSGFVVYTTRYPAGLELGDGEYICNLLTGEQFFVQTENQPDQFGFGMTLNFKVLSEVLEGTVVSAGSRALYGNLDTGSTVFSIAFPESVPDGAKMQMNQLTMEGKMKTVENVLLVPTKAVTVENDEYFVTVLKENGSLLKTEFIPGGSNAEFCWVLQGLEEGMQVVYQ